MNSAGSATECAMGRRGHTAEQNWSVVPNVRRRPEEVIEDVKG
jgi:hypothetical protein